MSVETVQRSLQNILEAISNAITTSPATKKCRLVAVSKTKPAELIEACYIKGQRHFGENYVQELEEKSAALESKASDIRWHFIGQVQSNKIGKICGSPGIWCVETIENEKHARLFDTEWSKKEAAQTPLRVLVQVNTSEEDNKGGIELSEAPKLAEFIRKECRSLKFDGFMTIGSFDNSHADGVNPDFEKLFRVRQQWAEQTGESADSVELSMGMSDDFLQAIQQGSTSVRVGSKLFGAREYKNK
uniref:Pyridoxal phosphate homeostasis protein n=1 Tax=Caenorhabditis tropicalis TaxID=1561998 RepID=A0A1I7TT01_9PELO